MINIVCHNYADADDWVLPRLARTLAKGTGWSLGATVEETAEVNVLFPYLEVGALPAKWKGKLLGWFTHRDNDNAGKIKMWETAAQRVQMRTACAHRYVTDLLRYGPARKTTPVVELERFIPKEHVAHVRPVMGVSGQIYPGGRKGEGMLKILAESDFAKRVDLKASGYNWPVPTHYYAWKDMPRFYWGLDVFLCTSTIEGLPLPPLEALACGIPIVVPMGVGMLEELPRMMGIYHYAVGSYDGMVKALGQALDERGSVDVAALRTIAERYSIEAWSNDFRVAVDEMLSPVLESAPVALIVPESGAFVPKMGTRGVYMVAYGDPARACAKRSIESIHKHMPGLPVCLVSDAPLGPEDVLRQEQDLWPITNDDKYRIGRHEKLMMYDWAPAEWEYVLYLDADTEIVAPIEPIFQWLADGWEMVICYNPRKYILARDMARPDNKAELDETWHVMGGSEFLQYNGGVMAFRRCKATATLLRDWYAEWNRWGRRDQAALDRVLYQNPVRIMTLGTEWNTITRASYCDVSKTAGILHHPTEARRWAGRLSEPDARAAMRESGAL